MRLFIPLTLWLLLFCGIAAWAQPMPEETWLSVRVLQADGAPLAVSALSIPTVNLYQLVGKTRRVVGQSMAGVASTVTGLQPGQYELRVSLPKLGWVDSAKTIEIFNGPNLMEWRLPPAISVAGSLTIDNQPLQDALQARAFILMTGLGSATEVPISISSGRYTLPALYPGKYRLAILSNTGALGAADFTIPPADATTADLPIALQMLTGVLAISVNSNGAALPNTPMSLIGPLVPDFTATIVLPMDVQGKGTIILPPGNWRWVVQPVGFLPANGRLELTGEALSLDVTLDTVPKRTKAL